MVRMDILNCSKGFCVTPFFLELLIDRSSMVSPVFQFLSPQPLWLLENLKLLNLLDTIFVWLLASWLKVTDWQILTNISTGQATVNIELTSLLFLSLWNFGFSSPNYFDCSLKS